MIDKKDWKWFGAAGHFICSRWCRFHLTTQVGKYLVSTVGEHVPSEARGLNDREERAYLNEHGFEKMGASDCTYETMVFVHNGQCDCGCNQPTHGGQELSCTHTKTPGEATAVHMALCAEFSTKDTSCYSCSDPDATFDPDPYAEEINDDPTPVWMCATCRRESADDI